MRRMLNVEQSQVAAQIRGPRFLAQGNPQWTIRLYLTMRAQKFQREGLAQVSETPDRKI